MKRIDVRRKKIEDYLSTSKTSTLYFMNDGREIVLITYDPNIQSLDDLVLDILRKADNYYSAIIDGDTSTYETSSGRLRSSLDIWRHAKSVLPDLDIFQVMEAIYRLGIDNAFIYGHYCPNVRRTVFCIAPHYGSGGIRATYSNEFKIRLSSWRCLHG